MLIPIYNLYVMLKIVGRPVWELILMFIPLVNFIIALILGFGSARYVGPAAAPPQAAWESHAQ